MLKQSQGSPNENSLTKHHGHETFLHSSLQEQGGNVDGAGGHTYLQPTRQHVDQEHVQ